MDSLNSKFMTAPPPMSKPGHSWLACLTCIALTLSGSHALAEEFGNHVMQSLEGRWQLNKAVTKTLLGDSFSDHESKDVSIKFAMDRPAKSETIGKFRPSERGFLYRTLCTGKMTQNEKASSFELLADEYGNTWLNESTNESDALVVSYEVTIARGIRPENDLLFLKAYKGGFVVALSRAVELKSAPASR